MGRMPGRLRYGEHSPLVESPTMSGDEFIALIASAVIAVMTWGKWLWVGLSVESYYQSRKGCVYFVGAVVLAGILLLFVLNRWSSSDVQDSLFYTTFYMVLGAGFTGVVLKLFEYFGLSVRDDVLERFNTAAAIAVAGATLGATAAFAGGNIGDGPGWWVVVFCAALSNGALLLCWVFLDVFAGVGDRITIERDQPTAWRVGGLLAAGGIIFGRAVAGTWIDVEATLSDYSFVGAGGLILWVVGFVAELRFKREPRSTAAFMAGFVPAAAYVGLALVYVIQLPRWK